MDEVKDYYRRITSYDIGEVARELLGDRIIQRLPQLLLCDCPHHASQSHRSLNILLDKQGWYCFGCGKGGDVLQLVEFIQSGEVTVGKNTPMPLSHRQARDFLAQRVGLPSLSCYGLTKDGMDRSESEHAAELRVKSALAALAQLYHQRFKDHPQVLEWFKSKYAINDLTVDHLLIGYADNAPGVVRVLTAGDHCFSLGELAATGAFRVTNNDGLIPFFDRRIIFPYWSRGNVAFMIGRKTPWTPVNEFESAKYKKLPVHDEHIRAHVARCIDNSILYNEEVLLSNPARLIITEGVTDCIALMERGFPAISPVAVRIRAEDWQRLVPRFRNLQTIYICQDNEVSQAGLKGAMQTARTIAEHSIETRVAVLPLGEAHIAARAELAESFGITAEMDDATRKRILQDLTPEQSRVVDELLASAKIDVNEFFLLGHSQQDFERILHSARTPIEMGIDALPLDAANEEMCRAVGELLREVAAHAPLEQNRLLRLVHEKIGGAINLATLKEQLRSANRRLKKEERQYEDQRKRVKLNAPPGSCRAAVEEALIETMAMSGSPDYASAAEAAYKWFEANGAMFFRTEQNVPFMYFDDAIYWMDSSDRGRKRQFAAMIYDQTRIVPTTAGGRTFFEVLPSLAQKAGAVRDHFSWLHTDHTACAIYFNLNNAKREIVKITPDNVEILKNGGNSDRVILECSRKMKPLHYLPDADIRVAEQLMNELIADNMTCSPGERILILTWVSCFLLMDFTGTRPMTRFEGAAGSGKTTASKLISTLLYGDPQHKRSTDAANYTDGSQNPLVVLDNIEVKQMTDELIAFMLTSITGVAREKRRGGTDTETVIEYTKCLINTTGIEPLCGELSEIQSRCFIVNFEICHQGSTCFIESDVIMAIQKNRDLIMSAVINKTQQVLVMIREGKRKRAMQLLNETLGNHSKQRCNEYLTLMYLMMLSGSSAEQVEQRLEKLCLPFIDQIKTVNEVSDSTARESNHTVTALATLFKAWQTAVESDRQEMKNDAVNNFIARYQLRPSDERTIKNVLSRDLFVALKRISHDFTIRFEMESARQFAQRFSNDLTIVRDAGFDVSISRDHTQTKWYTIRFRE